MKKQRKGAFFRAAVFLLIGIILLAPLNVSAAHSDRFSETTDDIVMEYRSTGGSEWNTFDSSTFFAESDGILLQTADKPYYLKYRCRDNYRGWLDPVSSADRGEYDYAGWPGYSVTNIAIEVYDDSGALYDDYVVMYRAMASGVWLDWVSSGTSEVMQEIKDRFGLDGKLDTYSSDAGWAELGYIQALEIRMFERTEEYPTPSPSARIIDAPYIYQFPDYPNGCESVSAVMALQYLGIDISPDEFIGNYLDMGAAPQVGGIGPDPNLVFCGDPRLWSGWGCYAPVICNALNKFISPKQYDVIMPHRMPLGSLCRKYIDNGIPVMVWATVGMTDSSAADYFAHWTTPDGTPIAYNRMLHCLLLVGYDENNYFFNDPMHISENGTSCTGYSRASVEKAYDILGRQSIVIEPKKPERYKDIIGRMQSHFGDKLSRRAPGNVQRSGR